MKKLKAVGRRGSWFAEVDGKRLPCVHKHWFVAGGEYCDPGVTIGQPVWDEFIDGLKMTGMAVLTDDKVRPDEKTFERTGYIAVFAIEDVRVEDNCLRFRFIERLHDLQ